jgi:hypothetical protein
MMRGSILLLICLCFASASGSAAGKGVEERQGQIAAIRQALEPAVKTGDQLAGSLASGHQVRLLHSRAPKHLSLVSCLLPHFSRGFCVPPMLLSSCSWRHTPLSESKHSLLHVCPPARKNAESRREQTFLSSGYLVYGRWKNSINGRAMAHCRRAGSLSGGVLWRKPAIWIRTRLKSGRTGAAARPMAVDKEDGGQILM